MARVHPEIYFFGAGVAEGRSEMRDLLGGKGANLAEMASLKLPVARLLRADMRTVNKRPKVPPPPPLGGSRA